MMPMEISEPAMFGIRVNGGEVSGKYRIIASNRYRIFQWAEWSNRASNTRIEKTKYKMQPITSDKLYMNNTMKTPLVFHEGTMKSAFIASRQCQIQTII